MIESLLSSQIMRTGNILRKGASDPMSYVPNAIYIIVNLVFFLGFPIFMLIASIPSLIVLDIIRERKIRFVKNSTKEMFVEVSFKEADQQ